jgi:hypothetical protein
MNALRWFGSAALALAMAVGVMAGPVGAQDTTHQDAIDFGELRLMHAVPNAPAIDVWLDGSRKVTDLAYGQFTGHLEVPPGNHLITVTPTGESTNQALINSRMDIAADDAYTVMAVGKMPDIRAIVLPDERRPSSPVQTDARLRVINAASDTPAFDVLRPNEQGVFNMPAVVSDVEFGTGSGYANINAGAATLRLEAVDSSNVLLTLGDARFAADGVYTLAVLPTADGTGLRGVWLWDKNTPS